jgi:hypothetical protein
MGKCQHTWWNRDSCGQCGEHVLDVLGKTQARLDDVTRERDEARGRINAAIEYLVEHGDEVTHRTLSAIGARLVGS